MPGLLNSGNFLVETVDFLGKIGNVAKKIGDVLVDWGFRYIFVKNN